MNVGQFDSIPLYVVYLAIALWMLLSFEVGYQIIKHTRERHNQDKTSALGPLVGSLLAMMSFVLVFTFSLTASQHHHRERTVVNEANAISTAYLRADLVDEQHKTEVKSLLREYVNIRLHAVNSDNLEKDIARSIELHELLWAQVSSAAEAIPNTNTSLLVQSINSVIDLHVIRLNAGLHLRITETVWLTLLAVSSLTMVVVGIHAGHSASRRLNVVIPMVLAFTALITVIAELDRPNKGLLQVRQDAMVSLQNNMNRDIK